MKSLYRIYMVLATVLMAVSCMVEEAGRSNRDKYNIIHYSENVVGLACVFQPVSAVAVARDADIYLSLSEQEKEEFDVASLFPGGIRHIDPNTVNIRDMATVYSYGTRFSEPGSEWTVKMDAPFWYDIPFFIWSYGEYVIRCIAPDTWEIVSEKSDFGVSKVMRDMSVTVKFSGMEGTEAVYDVVSSGVVVEDGGYEAECRTGEEGVVLHHDKGLSDNGNLLYDSETMKPYGGGFEVRMYKDGQMLDLCNITYDQGNTSYVTSLY